MPDFQNIDAKALHMEALKLYEEAQRAQEQADTLRARAVEKEREADRIEHATQGQKRPADV